MIHQLKINPVWFEAIKNQTKTFELRKLDLPFMAGDFMQLHEYYNGIYTNRVIMVEVLSVIGSLEAYGLSNDYGIISIKYIL